MKKTILFFCVLLTIVTSYSEYSGAVEKKLTNDEIKELLIARSIRSYFGSCPCPYNTDRGGRRCGNRSAWSKPGGASPLCYKKDVSDKMVKEYRSTP